MVHTFGGHPKEVSLAFCENMAGGGGQGILRPCCVSTPETSKYPLFSVGSFGKTEKGFPWQTPNLV